MTPDELQKYLATHEWYDNSRVRIIRGCKRKAFFSLIGPAGNALRARVGDGANFGSAMHAGLARYYNGWGKFDEPVRRVHAARAFTDEWSQYFPHERIQRKHMLARGLDILDAYFDHYLDEDSLFQPIEAELGFVVEIVPTEPTEMFLATHGDPGYYPPKPFTYIGRVDGVFKRLSTGELFLRETKTTSYQAENRLRQLKFDHQPVGYTYCVRHLAGENHRAVVGFMGDVILVSASKLEFCRDYFHVTQNQVESWRKQLINTVQDWRAMCVKADGTHNVLDTFYQDTGRCFEYGKCAFYSLCDFGISPEALDEFEQSTWNPLTHRAPQIIEQTNDK